MLMDIFIASIYHLSDQEFSRFDRSPNDSLGQTTFSRGNNHYHSQLEDMVV